MHDGLHVVLQHLLLKRALIRRNPSTAGEPDLVWKGETFSPYQHVRKWKINISRHNITSVVITTLPAW